jgi:GNAT superfamily N-acetyltransferase
MEDISITLATSDESEIVIQLLKDVAKWLNAQNIHQWGYLRNGGEDDEIREGINNRKTYIARINNKVVGTFTLYDIPSQWDTYIWGPVPDDAVYLHRIAVERDYQDKGLGAKLIKWIEIHLKNEINKKYIRLDCVAENERLNKYYVEHDFRLVGVNHDHCKYEKEL